MYVKMSSTHSNIIKILSFWQRFWVQFWGQIEAKNCAFARDILKKKKLCICEDVMDTLKYYHFGKDFGFNFGLKLKPKTVILLMTSFKNRIRDIF